MWHCLALQILFGRRLFKLKEFRLLGHKWRLVSRPRNGAKLTLINFFPHSNQSFAQIICPEVFHKPYARTTIQAVSCQWSQLTWERLQSPCPIAIYGTACVYWYIYLNVESKVTNNALQRTLLKAGDLPGHCQWCASIRSVTKNTCHVSTMKTKKQAQLEANKQVNGQKRPRLWTPSNLKLTG